jgi:hypothetical protein
MSDTYEEFLRSDEARARFLAKRELHQRYAYLDQEDDVTPPQAGAED